MSKTQIDRLGDRLKKGNITDDDLRLLDSYRRSFSEAYEIVVGKLWEELKLEPTGRPAKSTTSIADKLRRESIRLTQIQDIAGCRLIVPDITTQDSVVQSLKSLFENITIVDRRERPSHGYRAVHVIVNYGGKMIEIQVRTSLQHLWAELSEKLSDVEDPAIKYGGGDEKIQTLLMSWSSLVANQESLDVRFAELLSLQDIITDEDKEQIYELRQQVVKSLRDSIKIVENWREDSDDISD